MKTFPKIIPIFPLSGVIYFPKTNLPLNIFEKRYLDLVNDTYEKNKLMGMVQSQKRGSEVYEVGCLGKISDLQKSKDGRILINLTGITRFKILEAAACKTPIISTTLGAEGIPVRNNYEILIADTSEEFAQAIIKVINDKNLIESLKENCYKLVQRSYCVESLSKEAIYVTAVVVLMATWWATEAIPLPATALLPLALFPMLGIFGDIPAKDAIQH